MTSRRKELLKSLAIAGAFISGALLLVGARRLGLIEDTTLAFRLFGVAMGLILMAYGNVIPRRIACFNSLSGQPARHQKLLRFAGWAFVLAGLGNAAAWAFAPYKLAAMLSMAPLIVALLLVGTRIFVSREGKRA